MFSMPQIKVMTLVTENIAVLGSESGEDQEEL